MTESSSYGHLIRDLSWRRFITHRSSNQFAISDDRPFLGFCSLFAPSLSDFFSKPTHSGNNGVLYACGNHHGQVDHSSLGSQSLWVEQTCSSPLKVSQRGVFLASVPSFFFYLFLFRVYYCVHGSRWTETMQYFS